MAASGGINGNFFYDPFSKISVERLMHLNFHNDISNTSSTSGNNSNRWKWDKIHVRLPCALENTTRNGDSLWSIINSNFGNTYFTSGQVLGEKIKTYNSKHARTWRFDCLEEFSRQERDLFRTVVPDIINLARKLPELIKKPIPILSANQEGSVTLNQIQIASLLANAFLCTFPWRNDPKPSGGLPSINFNGLFEQRDKSSVEKLKCIFHYFRRVSETAPSGKVTFTRKVLKPEQEPDWRKSRKPLMPLEITDKGYIEDEKGMLQVDFANKTIGGGFLGRGAVQEEIRFAISPELIVARLFTEELQDNEALVITGTERFNKHSGYSNTFQYDGDFWDETLFDEDGRRRCSIVAIDAIHFRNPGTQYLIENVNRELIKAYSGFRLHCDQPNQLSPVATGNWGCGAFNGDPRLKAVIQLMAASQAGRQLRYFTHGDQELVKEMRELCGYFDAFGVKTVGVLYKMLQSMLPNRPPNILAALLHLTNSKKDMNDLVGEQRPSGQSKNYGQFQATNNRQHATSGQSQESNNLQQPTIGQSNYSGPPQGPNNRQQPSSGYQGSNFRHHQNQRNLVVSNQGYQTSSTGQTQGHSSNQLYGKTNDSTPTLTPTESESVKLQPKNSEIDAASEGSTSEDAIDKKQGVSMDTLFAGKVQEAKSKFEKPLENNSEVNPASSGSISKDIKDKRQDSLFEDMVKEAKSKVEKPPEAYSEVDLALAGPTLEDVRDTNREVSGDKNDPSFGSSVKDTISKFEPPSAKNSEYEKNKERSRRSHILS